MPLDPNIILSGTRGAGAGVDVNALYQQQMQGMEAINQMERQRKADELVMQDREASNLARALAPAIGSVFADPSDEGLNVALGLVPEQYRGAMQAQVDQLRGIPDLNRRKDVVRAALVQDDVGQALLAQLEPTANARLNAEVAAQRAAIDVRRLTLDEQKQKLDAQGKGAWELKEGEGGFFWTNPRTLEVVPANVTGADVSGAVPAPNVVTPRQPAPGAPEAAVPAGTAQTSAEQPKFRPKPKAASSEQTQEERRRAASVRYAVKNVDKVLQTIDKDPASFGQGADEFALSLLPLGAGEEFKSFVQDANRQQVYYRMNQTVATLLRLATGAAFTTPELVTEASSFMPKYGDDPATARDKLDALQDRILSEVGSTGRGFTSEDQAELNTLLDAFDTMKNKLYPEEAVNSAVDAGEVDMNNPLLKD